MILYFAGAEPKNHVKKLRSCGASSMLISYFYMKGKEEWLFTDDEDVLVDSGGFTARVKNEKIDVAEYAKWLEAHDINLAFNLDTNDVEETLENQEYLEKHTTAYILPIYHYSDYIEPKWRGLIEEYAENYPFISVGGMAGFNAKRADVQTFLDHVFYHTRDQTRVHGLGVSGEDFLKRYPFYSVDHTSWLCFEQYGRSMFINDKHKTAYRKEKIHYVERTKHEIRNWLKLEDFITNLWAKRGIKWEDFRT